MALPGARIILVARFFFYCMEIGLAKSFGVIIPENEEQLQASDAIVGLITSLSLAMMYLACPLSKVLTDWCPRPTMLTGFCGMAAGCALISTAFSRNTIVIGVLFLSVGFSCSILNLQCLVLLHEYYKEDFPFASSLTVLGIPIGSVILPPITKNLVESYGLGGTLMVVGALVLNMLPIGLVLKEPTSASKYGDQTEQTAFERDNLLPFPPDDVCSRGQSSRKAFKTDFTAASPRNKPKGTNQHHDLEDDLLSQKDISLLKHDSSSVMMSKPENTLDSRSKSDTKRVYKDSTIYPKEVKDESTVSSCLSFLNLDVLIEEKLFTTTFLPTVFLTFLVTGGWVLFIVLYAVEHGIDIVDGTYLATSGAVGGVTSSVVMSFGLRYHPEWSPQYLLLNQTMPTIFFFLQTLNSSYGFLLMTSFLIGFGLFGFNVTIEAVMAEVVEGKNFQNASGILYFCIGLGYILSGYVNGFVKDQTGSTEYLFVFLGMTSSVASFLTLIMFFLLRRKNQLEVN